MNDKEIAELRRRFRADKTSISRIRGAYVNEKREIISEMDQSVAMMTETEADEILSLLKKALSGKVDTNLIDINFTTRQVMESPEHKLLCNLRETALQDEEVIHSFYKKIIDSLEIEGNYMILLAYDCYDVFTYRKDGNKDDESSEMFRYILCAVCPVKMAKPSLSYYVKENCFRNVVADSVISPPTLGFMFPAFDNRSTNLYGALYYTRATDNSHKEFTDAVFNAGELPMPAAEQKETFRSVLADAAGEFTEEFAAEYDPKLPEAVEIVVEAGQASVSMLQRRMRVGYARAGRLIDEMQQRGIVSEADGAKPRSVLITREEMNELFSDEE